MEENNLLKGKVFMVKYKATANFLYKEGVTEYEYEYAKKVIIIIEEGLSEDLLDSVFKKVAERMKIQKHPHIFKANIFDENPTVLEPFSVIQKEFSCKEEKKDFIFGKHKVFNKNQSVKLFRVNKAGEITNH